MDLAAWSVCPLNLLDVLPAAMLVPVIQTTTM